MAARAIWKGAIRFGTVNLPVKLYSAAQDRRVHFRLLHAKDRVPVTQHMVNPQTDEPVDPSLIRRGYRLDAGTYVILSEEDLAALEPEASRDIEILRFVDPARIDHQWYERPYFLGPDADQKLYFGLARALADADKVGVARWVMRKQNHVGALRTHGDFLTLITLRHANEVIAVSELPRPASRQVGERERQMAEQLVTMYEDVFDPAAYKDEYRERVIGLVETKAKGGKVKFERSVRKAPDRSLADALKASIGEARRKKVA
jgi:DNA end-binding protein Ku